MSEPEKQYSLVHKHIGRLRKLDMLKDSPVVIMVERNLGFEVSSLAAFLVALSHFLVCAVGLFDCVQTTRDVALAVPAVTGARALHETVSKNLNSP